MSEKKLLPLAFAQIDLKSKGAKISNVLQQDLKKIVDH